MCRTGTYTPSSLQCVHFRNVFPPDSGVRAFLESIPSAFAAMQRGYYLFVFLVISGHACSLVVIAVRSKRPTVVAFSLFFWENLFVNA